MPVTLLEIITEERLEHLEKALLPMLVTPSGMVIELRLEHM